MSAAATQRSTAAAAPRLYELPSVLDLEKMKLVALFLALVGLTTELPAFLDALKALLGWPAVLQPPAAVANPTNALYQYTLSPREERSHTWYTCTHCRSVGRKVRRVLQPLASVASNTGRPSCSAVA